MTLDEWLTLHKKTCTETAFGGLIGKTQQSVNRYRRGEQMPDRDTMAKIVTATQGKVQPNDFYSSSLPRRRRTKADKPQAVAD